MKTFVMWVLILWSMTASAQSFGIRLGHSLTPADYLSLRYEHWTNGTINFTLAGFAERSKNHSLNYANYGADLQAEYASSRNSDALPLWGWRAGLGATWQIENDPWVYKDLPGRSRMNYGAVCELSGECFISDAFRLNAFIQQKLLFNTKLGSLRSCFGLGLTYLFPSL
ncbi:hypothetical protein SAMN05444410_10860 [Hydrobacter penzbergensis]|uniref:DUF3575 domain-containing protein n=1 Tax=Hydrobacter penzbergensis TaxID=1235997 RepID=A0A8X8LDX0_9BACT|nr:hypothetical protein [Hydrobacter penzbergensis]SDX02283.1 hypothetical protein SAMN05444410_10860 [Hydrobacter penzbergensis]